MNSAQKLSISVASKHSTNPISTIVDSNLYGYIPISGLCSIVSDYLTLFTPIPVTNHDGTGALNNIRHMDWMDIKHETNVQRGILIVDNNEIKWLYNGRLQSLDWDKHPSINRESISSVAVDPSTNDSFIVNYYDTVCRYVNDQDTVCRYTYDEKANKWKESLVMQFHGGNPVCGMTFSFDQKQLIIMPNQIFAFMVPLGLTLSSDPKSIEVKELPLEYDHETITVTLIDSETVIPLSDDVLIMRGYVRDPHTKKVPKGNGVNDCTLIQYNKKSGAVFPVSMTYPIGNRAQMVRWSNNIILVANEPHESVIVAMLITSTGYLHDVVSIAGIVQESDRTTTDDVVFGGITALLLDNSTNTLIIAYSNGLGRLALPDPRTLFNLRK